MRTLRFLGPLLLLLLSLLLTACGGGDALPPFDGDGADTDGAAPTPPGEDAGSPLGADSGADAEAGDAAPLDGGSGPSTDADATSPGEDAAADADAAANAKDATAAADASDAAPWLAIAETVPAGLRGVAYVASFTATGASPPSGVVWSYANGALPPGLALASSASAGATVSGVPTQAGTFSFTIDAVAGDGSSASLPVGIVIATNPPSLTSSALPAGTVGVAYRTTVNATAVGAVTWSVTEGGLPGGLVLTGDPSKPQATISGTPLIAGHFAFSLQASDEDGAAQAAYTIDIARSGTFIVAQQVLPRGRVQVPYAVSVATRNAPAGAVHWAIGAGGLPAGIALSDGGGGTASLAGTPGAAGVFPFTLVATAGAASASASFSIVVLPQTTWAAFAHDEITAGSFTVSVQDITGGVAGKRTDVGSGLVSPTTSSIEFVEFAPLQTALVFSTDTATYYSDMQHGGPAAAFAIGTEMAYGGTPVDWSFDGSHFVLVEPTGTLGANDYWMCAISSGPAPSCVSIGEEAYTGALFSPDGSRAAIYATDYKSAIVADTAGSTTTYALPAATPPLTFTDGMYWSPDGRTLLAMIWDGQGAQLYAIPVGSGGAAAPFPVLAPGTYVDPNSGQLSPDGSALFFATVAASGAGVGSAFVLDMGGELGVPAAFPIDLGSIEWTPGTMDLSVTTATTLEVLTNVLSTPAVGVSTGMSAFGAMSSYAPLWSPDGSTFVWSGTTALALGTLASPGPVTARSVAAVDDSQISAVWLDEATWGLLYENAGLFALDALTPNATPFRVDTDAAACDPVSPTAPGIVLCTAYSSVWIAKVDKAGDVVPTTLLDVGTATAFLWAAESP